MVWFVEYVVFLFGLPDAKIPVQVNQVICAGILFCD
jgi:hypothetical protein